MTTRSRVWKIRVASAAAVTTRRSLCWTEYAWCRCEGYTSGLAMAFATTFGATELSNVFAEVRYDFLSFHYIMIIGHGGYCVITLYL
jgi:hypothetical protein